MTYDEFQNEMNGSGYDVDMHYAYGQIAVVTQDQGALMGGDATIATVNTHHQFWFTMFDYNETLLDYRDWLSICSMCRVLATTPLNERGQKPRGILI